MTKYEIVYTSEFRRGVRLLTRRGYDIGKLQRVILKLANGETLPKQNNDHALKGNWRGYRECHIASDWLLIYRIDGATLTLVLSRTGTHADIFNL